MPHGHFLFYQLDENEVTHTLVDTVSEVHATVKRLNSQDKNTFFGCDCEGVNLSRTGQLCLLQIAVEKHVYLIDILTLGERAFHKTGEDYIHQMIQTCYITLG